MAEKIIRIAPDGTIYFLTHGDDDILKLGEPTIVRASHVRFDNDDKRWYVYVRTPDGSEERLVPGYKKRETALRREVDFCSDLLAVDPDLVEEMLATGMVKDDGGAQTSG